MANPYTLQFAEHAFEHLSQLEKGIARRIIAKLEWLAENADSLSHTSLKGQWAGYYKLRVGDYRVIYALLRDGRIIIVEVVGHRREIYDE